MSHASFRPSSLHFRNSHSNYIELNHYPNVSTYEPRHIPQTDSKNPNVGQAPPAQNWPARSQRVWALTPLRAWIFFFDVILASTPIMFIGMYRQIVFFHHHLHRKALALMAARLNGKDIDDYGRHLQKILLLSPTIFPVLFAALVSGLSK